MSLSVPSGRWKRLPESHGTPRPDLREGMVDMTTTASELHGSRPDAPDLSSAASVAQHVGGECLRDGPVGKVGLEIEAHCFDVADPMRRPGWDELTDVIASVPALPGGSLITVEPGGAVELSGPPLDGALHAIEAMAADRAVLSEAFARHGLGLGPARRRSTAAGRAGEPRHALQRDGALLPRERHRRCGCGDDDVDGLGTGQRRRRAARRVGGARAVGACAWARR